jgi:hypothetical protein
MPQAKTYTYSYSGKFSNFVNSKKTVAKVADFQYISYSHYYDWLRQAETPLAVASLTDTHSLVLTNKHLLLQSPQKKLSFPLQQVKSIDLAFKRLLFPLISGGISTPLFGVALWNQVVNFWLGVGIVLLSSSLLYYGWLGMHQVSINLSQESLHYFTDQKRADVEQLVRQTNQLLKSRKESNF